MTGRRSVGEGKNERGPKRVLLALGLCLCLVVAVMANVTAQADDPPAGPPARPTVAEMEGSLNANNSAVHEPELTNPQAAEELPHEDLDREQAAELISEVFSSELQAPAGIFDELEVEKFVSDNAAIIGAGDQPEMTGTVIGASVSQQYEGSTLLESTVPLRVEDASGHTEAVDLGLEHVEGELHPANPLVEVGIPQNFGEGIDISNSGVTIELQGAPIERAPSTVEGSVALYPEVAPDSSLAVAPTPSGLETLSLLQSPEAPTSETFHLDLPKGASLKATEAGGAEVTQGSQPLIGIPTPSALDANGEDVPVSLEVSGDSLVLKASPAEDAAYPILLDPVYEDYNWLNNITGTTGWKKFSTTSNYYADDHATCTSYASPYACQSSLTSNQKGMYLGLLPGSVPAGSSVGWEYHVPRWDEDWSKAGKAPTSFISSMTFEAFAMWSRTDTSSDPIMWTGIWNTQTPGWVSGYAKGGDTAPWNYPGNYQIYNAGQNTEGKVGAFTVGNGSGHNLTAFRDAFLGRAVINLGDNESPKLSPIKATPWTLGVGLDAPLTYTATDTGLGVARVEASDKAGHTWKTPTGTTCAGTAPNPCPRSKTYSEPGNKLEYEQTSLPQGINQLSVTAEDPLGNKSAPTTAEVLIDRTPPTLAISGTATEQAKAPNASEYKLKYSAADGDSIPATALTSFGGAGTTEGKTERPQGIAVDANGNTWVVDRTNLRVMEFDETGKLLLQFGKGGTANGQFVDPRGIAISSNGTVWVSDFGNHNVQAFNSKGEFVRRITTEMSSPYGLAAGPGEVLWVADPGTARINKYSESGSYLGKAYGSSTNPTGGSDLNYPIGLATDAAGNVWAVDSGNSRLKKYNASGKFIAQFGTTGTAAGQIQTPLYVAVARSGNLLITEELNNRVQEFQPNGVYLRQFGSTGSGSGQLSEARGIAISPGGTAVLSDAGNHRIDRWSHADFDPESGVVSTEVKVDGQLVEPKYAPGCPTENCSINNREWTLKANAYSSDQHTVKVMAIDGVGLGATKEFTITTDGTAPQLTANSAFFTAPGGWLEQKSYSYSASASDTGGAGVKSLSLKIDGKVVKSTEQTCPAKACSASISSTINIAGYKGGEHPAELVATDVAGNTSKKGWTINVDPKGFVPASEASATIEAVEETEPNVSYVAPTDELISADEIAAGNNPGLEQSGSELTSTGIPTETVMTTNPSAGLTIEAPADSIHVEPTGESEPTTIVKEEVAAVTSNTGPSVDTIVRPKYNGDMVFQSIRDATSPETFSWEVELGSRLSLSQIDEENIGVYHPDGSEAMLISAEPAHDAIGKAVATTIALQAPNIVTLTVHHKVAGVVYPVVSGASFEVGYETVETYDPPPPAEQEAEEAIEESEETPEGKIEFWHNAPIPAPGSDFETLMKTGRKPKLAEWGFRKCQTYYWCAPGFWEMHFKEAFLYNGREHVVGGEAWHDGGNRTFKDCTKFSTTAPFSISRDSCKWIGNHAPYGYGSYFCAQNEWHVSNHATNEYHAMTFHNYGDGYAGKKQNSDCSPAPY